MAVKLNLNRELKLQVIEGRSDPRWVDAVLEWDGTWLAVRIGLTGLYVISALLKLWDFPAAVLEEDQSGLHPGALWAALTIAVQLVGPALVISGRYVWLGAGMLGVFTAAAAVIAFPFWDLSGQAKVIAMTQCLEHLGLIMGFVMVALLAELRGLRPRAAASGAAPGAASA